MRANKRTNARDDDGLGVPCFKEKLVAELRAAMPTEEEVDDALVVFSALADRTRLKLLYALRHERELCVCDVSHVLGMSVSAASHHLRKLRDLRILKCRNDGKMAYYSLREPFVAELLGRAFRQAA